MSVSKSIKSDKTLLLTKLHRPPTTRDLLERPLLVEQINNGIARPLFMVLASAGFGKSTLVSAWLDQMTAGKLAPEISYPSVWLQLDENDSDLTTFIRYLIAALRTIFEDACEKTLMLIHSRQPQAPDALYASLSNEIEQLGEDFILVLDDYHTIKATEVHDLLNRWTHHWPKPMHLVLISRISPPVSLSKMRAQGMVTEIRARDLRFTSEETAVFLSLASNAVLSQKTLQIMDERFEGWPAGLHLAALSLRAESKQEAILSALSKENMDIAEYLVDEVLFQQFPAIQSFLLKTSILERFCPALCESFIGEIDATWNVRACMDWIERSELFLIPLDNQREWYRFHHLFKEFLQRRLTTAISTEGVKNLHILASAWFEEQGLLDEALYHSLKAGDLNLAAHQMSAGLCDVLNHQDRLTLDRWQRLLPDEMFQQTPQLMMIRIWSLEFKWKLDLQFQLVQQLDDLLMSDEGKELSADDLHIIQGQILTLKAQWAYLSNQQAQAINLCRQALALIPHTWTYLRGGTMLFLGMSMQAIGQSLAAERLLLKEYEAINETNNAYTLQVIEALGFNYLNSGQLNDAERIGQLLAQGGAITGLGLLKNWGDYYRGVVHFEQYKLEFAEQDFSKVNENRFTANLAAYRESVAGLALVKQSLGNNTEAWQLMEDLSRFDMEQSGKEENLTRSLRARLMLLQGNMEGAGHWADTITDPPPDVAMIWLEEPQITRIFILVTRGTDADLHLALDILGALDEIANRTHNTRRKIEILSLRARALDALGEVGAADKDLRQALALSRQGGFIRVYVDLGKPMQKMLQKVAKQDRSMEFVQQILSAFPDDGVNPIIGGRMEATTVDPMPLIVPLTSRELDVLNLLRGPMSVKEIALKLGISYATTKRHTINIYAKLGVNQRWAAVARAEEIHILPPH